jgi:hypothetical protein
MFMGDTKGNNCGRMKRQSFLELASGHSTASGRFEEEGFDGRFDYRLGKPSANRAEDRTVQKMTRLYEERYRGFNVKHFHEYAQREHGLKYSYTWAKNTLEKAGLIRKGKRGGDHRLRRERRPMAGMMLHQDGSTHRWIPAMDYKLDLIITMDDAISEITSGFLVPQEGTDSSFQGVKETIEKHGLFCSLYTVEALITGHTRSRRKGRQASSDAARTGVKAIGHSTYYSL